MDLLEYMRSQNNMTQAEWERTFEDEAREILVLLAGGGGAGKRNGFWDVSHYFIAYVDCQTGALHTGDGRIVYPVSSEEHDAGGILDRFGQEVIYRVKARKKVPHEVPEGVAASVQNQFLIVEVLEERPRASRSKRFWPNTADRSWWPMRCSESSPSTRTTTRSRGRFCGAASRSVCRLRLMRRTRTPGPQLCRQ